MVASPSPEVERSFPVCNRIFNASGCSISAKGAFSLESTARAGLAACSQVDILSMAVYNANRLLFSKVSALLEM